MSRGTVFHLLINAIFLVLMLLLGLLTGEAAGIVRLFHPFLFFAVLSGVLTGPVYAAALGVLAPLLLFLLFRPFPLFPETVTHLLSAGAAGLVAGLYYYFYRTAVGSTLSAVVAWCASYGIVRLIALLTVGESYFFTSYLTEVFAERFPGLLLTLVAVPLFTVLLRKKGAMWVLRQERDD